MPGVSGSAAAQDERYAKYLKEGRSVAYQALDQDNGH
ncbi:predicted protein [Sclerotinia sclerotiorum 1980 UF-70]|uniref:Uncharacterized protein n=1 Tax=Sclerotinia sclerotiorum (strain ATCC 18683 / 1980 / Ss-1) TaxID=665079 RepID=A7EDB0_SCLS1|nr:predicted protein [Sclerotinia sclerotiorum 1980 UF-70]EDO00826.1 predicted protein [Sclerotinia sclerotiorum 1980 UF-70]